MLDIFVCVHVTCFVAYVSVSVVGEMWEPGKPALTLCVWVFVSVCVSAYAAMSLDLAFSCTCY